MRIHEIPLVSDHPDILYKYMNNKGEFTRPLFENRSLYFARFSKMNDINEGRLLLTFDDYTIEEIEIHFKQITAPGLGIPPHQINEEWVRVKRTRFWEDVELQSKIQYEINDKTFGAVCLTEDPLSEVMWGKYANENQGLCLGFDVQLIQDFRNRVHNAKLLKEKLVRGDIESDSYMRSQSPVIIGCYQIQYMRELRNIAAYDVLKVNDPHAHARLHLVKKFVWAHEKEWRLIAHVLNDKRTTRFPPKALKQLMFGPKATNETIDEYVSLCHEHGLNPQFYKVKLCNHHLALEEFNL